MYFETVIDTVFSWLKFLERTLYHMDGFIWCDRQTTLAALLYFPGAESKNLRAESVGKSIELLGWVGWEIRFRFPIFFPFVSRENNIREERVFKMFREIAVSDKNQVIQIPSFISVTRRSLSERN